MGIGQLFEMKKRVNPKTPYNNIVKVYGNSPRYSEVNYTTIAKEGYMENHVFNRCLREIINAAIQGRWQHCVLDKDGNEIPLENSQFVSVLNKPNAYNSKEELIKRMISYYYIGGEAPLQKIQTIKGITSILTYRPDKISMTISDNVDIPYKDIKYTAGSVTTIDPKSFTLWKNFNPLDEWDGLGHGMSALQSALKSGDLLNAFIDYNVSLLQNSARPSGAYVIPESLDPETFERAKSQIKNNHQGTRNAGNVLLLEGGGSWIKMGENPKDMDWKEGKESTIVDICSAIGPDPILVGYGKYSTYNNKKEAKKDLYTSHVIPLMSDMAGMFTKFLNLPEGEYIKIDYTHVPVMQEDMSEKYKRISESKMLTINEKRKALGYEQIKGGDIIGDHTIVDGKVYAPMNLSLLGEE